MITVATTGAGMVVGSFVGWAVAWTTSNLDDFEGFIYKTLGGAVIGTLAGAYLGSKI
jgi:NhaP-type Na+/H+ or K+/H+ antiporter